MEVHQVLRMNGGHGEKSYANNSVFQKEIISKELGIIEDVITEICVNMIPKRLCIADLGCSSGPNTFWAISQVLKFVDQACKKLDIPWPDLMVFLNDLPGNDFNSIFQSLPLLYEKLMLEGRKCGPCYVAGIPGSFHGRIFPCKSLHFVHSSSSLHWLSQAPKSIQDKDGTAYNRRNIYISDTSPPGVCEAYLKQFSQDFSSFLRSRSEEMIEGGRMVLTFPGRRNPNAQDRESCFLWGLVSRALCEMVELGFIEEEKLDSFNLPLYTASMEEVKLLVENEGSFRLDHIEVFAFTWGSDDYTEQDIDMANTTRAILEPILSSCFSSAIMNRLFQIFEEILKKNLVPGETKFVNLMMTLTKKPVS